MASIITRRPIIGFISGSIFSTLGMLIMNTTSIPNSVSGIVRTLHIGVGSFLIFVGIFSVIAAMISLWSDFRAKKKRAPSPDRI